MADRMEAVITHLQIIHTWAEFARERDLQFFTPKHLDDIAQWSSDALMMIEEQKQMYYTLEHDWRMLKELMKEQEEMLRKKQHDLDELFTEYHKVKNQLRNEQLKGLEVKWDA